MLIDGKGIAASVREEIKAEIAQFAGKLTPGLAVVLVGEDPASQVYVRNKTKMCAAVGIHSEEYRMEENVSESEVLARVAKLNQDPKIHGILVQLPLPKHINTRRVLDAVRPEKDVDGFHYLNVGKLVANQPALVSCTPRGVIELLDRSNIDIEGANAVVVGRSDIVGKPTALLLLHRNATVTLCHSRTRDLSAVCREADILIAAIGRAHFITEKMVKPGATVIDVGINRLPNGKLAGDVDFAAVSKIAGAITPVPGGVGPMTIAMLLSNTLLAAKWTLTS